MKYCARKSADGVFFEISLVDDEYKFQNTELELTEEEAVAFPIPCKIVDGEYVPAQPPVAISDPNAEPEPEPEPSAEDITLELLAEHEERICMLELTSGI